MAGGKGFWTHVSRFTFSTRASKLYLQNTIKYYTSKTNRTFPFKKWSVAFTKRTQSFTKRTVSFEKRTVPCRKRARWYHANPAHQGPKRKPYRLERVQLVTCSAISPILTMVSERKGGHQLTLAIRSIILKNHEAG